MAKVYLIKDTVKNNIEAVVMGGNEKEVVRDLAMCGFFKTHRVHDTEIVESIEITECKEIKKIDLKETFKKLEIEWENKAKETSPEDLKKKIKKTEKGAK